MWGDSALFSLTPGSLGGGGSAVLGGGAVDAGLAERGHWVGGRGGLAARLADERYSWTIHVRLHERRVRGEPRVHPGFFYLFPFRLSVYHSGGCVWAGVSRGCVGSCGAEFIAPVAVGFVVGLAVGVDPADFVHGA